MRIIDNYKRLGKRSRESVLNIISSFAAKGTSMLVSLFVVPLTINYLDATQFGIWVTLSSIIAWIGFFDLGFGNGMRNKFAESKAKGNLEQAQQYVSTAYFAVSCIVISLLLILEVTNLFLNWPIILNIDSSYADKLQKLFAILTAFFCLDMVLRLFTSLLAANQKTSISSWIGVCGQLISLGVIYLLTKTTEGSLLKLALYYSGIPTIVLLFASAIAFKYTSYRQYAPNIHSIRLYLVKDIMNIGVQFFVISLCLLVIFQVINLVITRELGPESVTTYNVVYKYFNIAHSLMTIILVPFWSAFTDAYYKCDINWMKKVKKLLEILWICEIVGIFVMVLISQWFYEIWIGTKISIENIITVAMAFYIGIQGIGAVYMNLINGIGTIRIQLIIYIIFAIISWPLMQFACSQYGLVGVLVAPTLVCSAQAMLGKIQLEKILNGTAEGIWIK